MNERVKNHLNDRPQRLIPPAHRIISMAVLSMVLTAGYVHGDPSVRLVKKSEQRKLFDAVAKQQKLLHAQSPRDAIHLVAIKQGLTCASVENAYFHTLFDEDIQDPRKATFVSAYCDTSQIGDSSDAGRSIVSGRGTAADNSIMKTTFAPEKDTAFESLVPSSYEIKCVTDAHGLRACTVRAQY